MAAIAHAFTEQNTAQTTTSGSYVDVSGASISSGNFIEGKKYLIGFSCQLSENAADATLARCKMQHGTTDFTDSIHVQRPFSASEFQSIQWFTVWTAVSSEGIKLLFNVGGGNTATMDAIFLYAICLSDDVVENTDWFFAFEDPDNTLSTTFEDGAAITFTPGTASQDWLVKASGAITSSSSTTSAIARLQRSGEASSNFPEARYEDDGNAENRNFAFSRVYNLGASSNTFKFQSATTSGTSQVHRSSNVFALNLHKFASRASAYTEADTNLSATNYATELATMTMTPSVTGDVFMGCYFGFDRANAARTGEFRLQVYVTGQSQVDQPAGQTTDNRQFDCGSDATDEIPCGLWTMASLTGSSEYTFDFDGSASATTSTPTGQHRSLWAFSMELAAAAAVLPRPPVISQTAVQHAASW